MSPSLDCFINEARNYPALTLSSHALLDAHVNEHVRAEDEVSPEVGPGDSRSACTQSVSPQPLVRISLCSGEREDPSRPRFTGNELTADASPLPLELGVSCQFSQFSSSSSSTPGSLATSQKTSTNSPATSYSAPTPATAYVPSASISSTPASHSQTPNALCCCDKTFRRPCDLRRHTKLHTKPLKCPVCGTGFPDRKALDRHTVARHPDVTPTRELHHCPVQAYPTQYVSARRDNCVRHIAKVHDKERGRHGQGARWEPRTVATWGG